MTISLGALLFDYQSYWDTYTLHIPVEELLHRLQGVQPLEPEYVWFPKPEPLPDADKRKTGTSLLLGQITQNGPEGGNPIFGSSINYSTGTSLEVADANEYGFTIRCILHSVYNDGSVLGHVKLDNEGKMAKVRINASPFSLFATVLAMFVSAFACALMVALVVHIDPFSSESFLLKTILFALALGGFSINAYRKLLRRQRNARKEIQDLLINELGFTPRIKYAKARL